MTRCFLAFEFSAESRAYLEGKARVAYRVLMRDAGWPLRMVRPENWHVTLLFFDGLEAGERAAAWAPVEAAARAGVWAGLGFDWRGFAVWPTPRRPSLVCLEGGELPGVPPWPLPVEQEPFRKGKVVNYLHYRPHATLMRFGRRGRGSVAREWPLLARDMPRIDPGAIAFDRVSLCLSTLTEAQPVYPREFTAVLG